MSKSHSLSQSANLLIEIFTEELPPKSLRRLGDAFIQGIFNGLKGVGLTSPSSLVTGFATPRRLAVFITDVLRTWIRHQIIISVR